MPAKNYKKRKSLPKTRTNSKISNFMRKITQQNPLMFQKLFEIFRNSFFKSFYP